MTLEVAVLHKEQLLLLLSWPPMPFTAALTLYQKITKPRGWPSAKMGVGSSSQKPSHRDAPLQVRAGLTHSGGSQAALHRLGGGNYSQLMQQPEVAPAEKMSMQLLSSQGASQRQEP